MAVTCYKDLLEEDAAKYSLSIPDYIDLLKSTQALYNKLLADPIGMIERISRTECDCSVKMDKKYAHLNPANHALECRYRRMYGL
jgi:hypothetical protein